MVDEKESQKREAEVERPEEKGGKGEKGRR